jgi:hypothetical protein
MEKEANKIKEFIRKMKGNYFDKVKPMKDSTKAWEELAKKEMPAKQMRAFKKHFGKDSPFGKGLKQGIEQGYKK